MGRHLNVKIIIQALFLISCGPLAVNAADALLSVSTAPSVIAVEIKATSATPTNTGPTSPSRVLPGEPVVHKNYLIPALEIPLFQLTLNQLDRRFTKVDDYDSTLATGWRHVVHGPWVVDQDSFSMNQIGHPYSGTVYYGFARSSGLNFWEGLIYTNAGSFLWETYGEITSPSINDQVASGNAGALVGESLYRMANLVLEGSGEEQPGFWRELGAGLLSPPNGLNRFVFGRKYSPVLQSRRPAIFAQVQGGGGKNSSIKQEGSARTLVRSIRVADFSMAYGLPGKPGYLYLRPFDYFNVELSGLVENHTFFENASVRGLLFGKKAESEDDNYRGVWGLYGTFDYFYPQIFSLSTTAASFGSTGQWWLSRKLALQGTGLAGVGYGAAGTIQPAGDERDYHYGATPQGLLTLRLIYGGRLMLDSAVRGYYISSAGASRARGTEKITRFNTSFMLRVHGRHAVGVNYLITSRAAHYKNVNLPYRHQLVETIGIVYNYLSDINFGAVGWGSHGAAAR